MQSGQRPQISIAKSCGAQLFNRFASNDSFPFQPVEFFA
jgi:hypothetical protein